MMRSAIGVTLACLLTAACAVSPGQEAAQADFIAAQSAEAKRLESEGSSAQALAVWRTLLPLVSAEAEAAQSIAALESSIAAQVEARLAAGRRAYSLGNTRQGDLHMLRVLALQPGQPEAMQSLAPTASKRASAQQRDKSEQEYLAALARRGPAAPEPAPPNPIDTLERLAAEGNFVDMVALGETLPLPVDPPEASLLRTAHIALADTARSAGKPADELTHLQAAMTVEPRSKDPLAERSLLLRGELSRRWYERGSRLMSSDIEQAIAALEKSLSFNPYNDRAQRKLDQANVLQRNLRRIEGGS